MSGTTQAFFVSMKYSSMSLNCRRNFLELAAKFMIELLGMVRIPPVCTSEIHPMPWLFVMKTEG